ncbi:hypothetical protein Cni_G14047 [Canna indica]|uniref:Uncharacterized protein n=1 Tax=Canna indica TaxID=4628 RepID=A0AAQ3KB03_9LILI|nr:hypothetical protein Cni_G14047 [Canna indica]
MKRRRTGPRHQQHGPRAGASLAHDVDDAGYAAAAASGLRVKDVQPAVRVLPGARWAPNEPQEAEARGRRGGGEAEGVRVLRLRAGVRHRAGVGRAHAVAPGLGEAGRGEDGGGGAAVVVGIVV